MAGALRQFVVTHDGAVNNLGTLFPADAGTPLRELIFTQQGAAAAYIGEAGNATGALTSTNYALSIPASAAREVRISAVGATPLKLKDLEVLGTNTQKLSIAGIAF